ncbi:MAG: hypothetical protein AB7U59_00495 [Desulfovibrionaceae bacterium]|jgi:hypothetical protein
MKIQTDQLTTQWTTKESSSETQPSSDAFASLLAKEVGAQASQESGLAAPPLSGLGAMAGLQNVEDASATAPTTEDASAAMDTMDSLLDQWDDYTEQLASGTQGDSLKKAYGVLENIASGVQELKNSLPVGANSTLSSMVNEMDVLATTEQIKFNRGDYL